MNHTTSRAALATATAVLALAGLTACGSDSSSDPSSTSSAQSSTSPKPTSSAASPSSGASDSASAAPEAATAKIGIKDFAYQASGTVEAGAKVTVTNDDSEAHTVTADGPGGFDVNIPPGKSATFTAPTKAGSYKYHCTFHSDMHGTLTVG